MQLHLSLHGALFSFVCSVIVKFSTILEGLALSQFLECLFPIVIDPNVSCSN